MHGDFTGVLAKGTFELVDKLPGGRKALGTKWLYSRKTDEDRFVTKPKARFVCLGNLQHPGIDLKDTSAPTPPSPTLRGLTAYACQNNVEMYHLDVEQACIQPPLEEEIYVLQL
ncbi:unnamed protein product [Sphacelaria rigidula]